MACYILKFICNNTTISKHDSIVLMLVWNGHIDQQTRIQNPGTYTKSI